MRKGEGTQRFNYQDAGADPGFQVRGGALKKIAPSRGRSEKFWGISCEKSRFHAKKSYFSNFRGEGARNFWGISCEKSRFYAKKIIFLSILGGGGGGRAGCAPPPPESAPEMGWNQKKKNNICTRTGQDT